MIHDLSMTPAEELVAFDQIRASRRAKSMAADFGNPLDLFQKLLRQTQEQLNRPRLPELQEMDAAVVRDVRREAVDWASNLNRNERHIQWAKDAKEYRKDLSPCAAPSCIHCDALREHIEAHGLDEQQIRYEAAPVPGKPMKKKRAPMSLWDEKKARAEMRAPMTHEDSKKKLDEVFARFAALPLPSRPTYTKQMFPVAAPTRTDPKLVERFGKVRGGTGVVWDDRGVMVPVNEPEEEPDDFPRE